MATLLKLKFQPAEMFVSFTATLLRWKFQLAEILSVTQPLFWGGHYNLLKYYQLHSYSSKAVISICWNVGQLHSHSSEVEITTCQNILSYTATLPRIFLAVITTCQNVGQLHSHSPLAHCWPTGGHLNLTVGRPITSPIVVRLAMSTGPLLMPIMSCPLPGQSLEKWLNTLVGWKLVPIFVAYLPYGWT